MAETPHRIYSCGHPRTEKGKHTCAACRALRQAARAAHQPQKVISARRRKAALLRIEEALHSARNRREMAARLGVSRQRVHSLLKWREKQLAAG